MEIDPKTGLPVEAMAWEDLTKKGQRVKVTTVKRRYGKITTVVSGFEKDVNAKDVAKSLKGELACGGTVKDGNIELQGDHRKKVKPLLIKLGFEEDSIED
jgi:translation initiation factor 1